VSYDDELSYKKAALLFLLRSFALKDDDIELIPAPARFGYRNRVQLHYRHKYIGLVDATSGRILEVPNCRLLREELKPAFDRLYADKNWTGVHKGAEGKNKDGHCEIYLRNGEVSIEWDAPYASGGFTQVNEPMNDRLRLWLQQRFSAEKFSTVLDLFAGNGNLSDVLLTSSEVKRMMVDSCAEPTANSGPQFIKQDLFADDALERFVHRSKLKEVDLLLLDPPRKGFACLAEWVKRFHPKYLVYVSCNPATLSRDLQTLMKNNKQLKISDVVLLDMFPGTRHFETVVVIDFDP
jgi:23S rRNA (uracil1939-C5)-methyltransferase